MKTVFVVITRGWDVRGILRTGVLRSLKDAGIRCVVLNPNADKPEFRQEFSDYDLEYYESFVPGKIEGTYRRAVNVMYAARFPNHTLAIKAEKQVRDNAGGAKGRLYRTLQGAARLSPALYDAFRLAERLFPVDRRWKRLFARWKPDAVITAPLFDWSDLPILKVAARRGIPTASIVASWDNISSKGAIPIRPDALVVWNEDMAMEAQVTHGYPATRVAMTGVPPFDHWAEPPRPREDWCRRVGIDGSGPILGYLGASASVLRNEHEVIEHLIEDNSRGAFGKKLPLYIRLHPRERRPEMLAFQSREGVRCEKPAHSSGNDWDANLEDLRHLADTIRATSVSMNVCSTVTIESCIADQPVFNIGYDGDQHPPPDKAAARLYTYTHYRRIPDCGIPVAYSREQMVDLVRRYLADPVADREARARVVRHLVGTVGGAAERTGRALAAFVLEGPDAIARGSCRK